MNVIRCNIKIRTLRFFSYGTLTFFLFVFLFYVHVFQQRYSIIPSPSYLYDFGLEEPLDTNQTCRYPNLDPFDPSIRSYLSGAAPIFCRQRQYTLTYLDDDGWLRINQSALQESGYRWNSLDCHYRDLIRPPNDDDNVDFGPANKLDIQGVEITAEFISVRCTNFVGLTVYTNLHAHIPRKKPSSDRKWSSAAAGSKDDTNKFNVQILVIDSMSRSNFIRQMPKTYMYLLRDLGATVLRGMTKLGDNTFPNLSAVLIGKQVYHYPELADIVGTGFAKPEHYDDWPLIWKNFSSIGYATLFAEDQPRLSLFNYLDNGFKEPPTDHYIRPFWLTLESSSLHRMSSNLCFGDVPKHLVLLDYLRRFWKTYKNSPHFGFGMLTEINHDVMNQIGAMDDDMVNFLKSSLQNGYLDNTVLVIMGDHGHRMDPIQKTSVGSLEGRLPFTAVYLPSAFIQQFPEAVVNLQINGRRLTSMLDLHYTLKDILELAQGNTLAVGSNVQQQGGTTLFGPISATRTCAQAGIPGQFCACDEESPVSTEHPATDKAATALLSAINTLNEQTVNNLCASLTLHNIHSALLLWSGTKSQDADQLLESRWNLGKKLKLRLTVETLPGNGLFQGVVVLSKNKPAEVMNGISRVNRYGSQGDCVSDPKYLKLYCYCINQ